MSNADVCPSGLLENPASLFEITQNVSSRTACLEMTLSFQGFTQEGGLLPRPHLAHVFLSVLGHPSEVVPTLVSLLSLLPPGIILSCVVALVPWLISSSSLHPTPFLPRDHAHVLV